MRVALVSKQFSMTHGGAERFSVNLARKLCNAGHEVHAVAEAVEDLPSEVQVHFVRTRRKPAFWRVVSFAKKARQLVSGLSVDVVYGLTQFFPQDLYRMGGGVHRHWMRVRYPSTVLRLLNYMVNPAHLAHIWLENRIYRTDNYRLIVTNSKLCREHAQIYYNVPAERIRVVYNGVDHCTFNPEAASLGREPLRHELGIDEHDLVVLFVASNWKRKGLGTLLSAIAELGDEANHLHVLVVGRGRPEAYRALAQKLGLTERLHFVGATKNVLKYYGAADLFVLPTLYDPFANVCLEAMACGLPVITTADNGASEIISSGDNGFIQKDPRDARELGEYLRASLLPHKRVMMGKSARKTAETFTLEKNLEETLDLFHLIVQESQAR
jgi:UDP-glucose:(heptosyl)LPS alpha-1,3-glucosyltransferase